MHGRLRLSVCANIDCKSFLSRQLNSLSLAILRLLADGAFHSGEALAERLGVSRASIWQALQGVEDYGVELHSVRGKGYRLQQPIEWLDRDRVLAAIDAGMATRLELQLLDCAESTNATLMRMAAQARTGTVLAAEWQSAGRGRLGRRWLADLGGSLLFSLLWRFERGIAQLSGLSLAVGVALIRALQRAGIDDASLKWPNDVLWRGGKLAGILIEVSGDTLGPSQVVIGVGLNLRLGDRTSEGIDQPAAALLQPGGVFLSRNHLLGCLLQELVRVLDGFAAGGFAALRDEWQRYHGLHGRPVRLIAPDGRTSLGVVAGVTDDGTLLLDEAGVLRQVHTGELSLRGL